MEGLEAHVTSSACNPRIVGLCQGAIEAVCALGLESYLVGRAQQCIGPASVLALPSVSSFDAVASPDLPHHCYINDQNAFDRYNINWELLQELKPDLIFAQSPIKADTHLPIQAQQLLDRNCRIISLQSHTVEDIFQNLQTIANCCGVEKEGAKITSLLRSRWKNIKQKTPQWADGMPHVNVACLSHVNPLIGAGYWIPEIISCAGGLSLCGTAGCPSKSLTLGDLVLKSPDVVIYISPRLYAASLAAELSWLVTSKEWRSLKAIKANRFFLIDANRFFIDSAPNVISSAEIMTEILHGFGYGHEGKGFVRWQNCAVPKDMPVDGKVSLQKTVVGTKAPILVGDNGSFSNDIDVDKHEVCSSVARDHPKYVTTFYSAKKPALPQSCWNDLGVVNANLDKGDRELGVLESGQEDAQQDIKSAVDARRCTQAKVIRQVPSNTEPLGEKVISNYTDGKAVGSLVNLGKPVVESLSCKQSMASSMQKSLINSFVQDQMETMVDLKLGRGQSSPNTSFRTLPKQSAFKKITSSGAYSQADSTEGSFCEQELISKVWASTKSAAQMRNRERAFQKSVSLPVSRGSPDSKVPSGSSAHLLGEPPTKGSFFSIKDNIKPLREGPSGLQSAKNPFYASRANCDQAGVTQISTARRNEENRRAKMAPKRRGSYSVPSSPRLDVKYRKSKLIRDAVLKSLVDLPYTDCLLLSGGLASSILAEAVPLVHSKGFKLGFTVLAGPAATDRVSAAVAAKCKGMEHVIIGENEKGFAVFLLAKELAFIVETLKTFDPVQIRNLVPIAAALREARSRGLDHVVTGDGLDELLVRDGIPLNEVQTVHLRILKVLSKSAVLLGEALGIKVVQPFLHSKLIRECKASSCTEAVGNETTEHGRAIMREAFPEVSAACREKSFSEVDSGMFYVSDYFSSAISASVLEKKAKHIYQKERICIRDAEHLVYYRAFKRAFKGKPPKGMVRWASKPCSGCGYQLSSEMSWYCLACGLTQQSHNYQSEQHKIEAAKVGNEENSSNRQGSSSRLQHSASDVEMMKSSGAQSEEIKETGSVASFRSKKVDGGCGSQKFESGVKRQTSRANQSSQDVEPLVTRTKSLRRPKRKSIKVKQPNLWAILGAGSAGLLLLLQLSRK